MALTCSKLCSLSELLEGLLGVGYINGGGCVYALLLDASKAFDRVNFIKLFRLLLKKGMCPMTARLLAVMYTSQQIRVRWDNFVTNTFSTSNGVKQGGVLSPVLFAIH